MTEHHHVHPTSVLRLPTSAEAQCVAWHPSQLFLFAGYSDGCGQLWSLDDRRVCQSLEDIHSNDGGILQCLFVTSPSAGLVLVTQGKEGLVQVWPWDHGTQRLRPTPLHATSTGAYGFCRIATVLASPALLRSLSASLRSSAAQPDRGQGEPSTSTAGDWPFAAKKAAPPSPTSPRPSGGLSALLGGEKTSQTGAKTRETGPGERAASSAAPASPWDAPRLLLVHPCEGRGKVRLSDALRDETVGEWDPEAEALNLGMVGALVPVVASEAGGGGAESLVVAAGFEDGGVALLRAGGPTRGLEFVRHVRLLPDPLLCLALARDTISEDRHKQQQQQQQEGARATASLGNESLADSAAASSPTGLIFRGAAASSGSVLLCLKLTVTVGEDGNPLPLLDVRQRLELPAPGVGDLTVRPDCRLLLGAGWDGRVRVYDMRKGKPLAVLKYHTKGATAVAYPEGGTDVFCSAGRDGGLALWEVYGAGSREGSERSPTSRQLSH